MLHLLQLVLFMSPGKPEKLNQHIVKILVHSSGCCACMLMTVLVQDHFYSDSLNLHVTSQTTDEL